MDDRLVALEGGSLLSMKDEPIHMTVELSRQQQVNDGGFDVFLLILVCIEGVSKINRDVIWKKYIQYVVRLVHHQNFVKFLKIYLA